MSLLRIRTNRPPDERDKPRILAKASALVSERLGTSNPAIHAYWDPAETMKIVGDSSAVAQLELKDLGLPEERAERLALALCDLMEKELSIARDRIHVRFTGSTNVK